MRKSALMVLGLLSPSVFAAGQAPPAGHRPKTAASESGYHFEPVSLGFDDLLTLSDGTKRVGKVMEWADQILLFDRPGEPTCYAINDVREFQLRRRRRHLQRPMEADLTIAYIERLPRDVSWQERVKLHDGVPSLEGATDADSKAQAGPAAGTKVTFRVHVLNAGTAKSGPATCVLTAGGAEIANGPIDALQPGEEKVIEGTWVWQDGKTIRAEVKPGDPAKDVSGWNNVREESASAIGVCVLVSRDLRDRFGTVRNIVDTFCIEDWIRYQLDCFNALMAASTYPTSPQGVLERVRCDRIVVFDGTVEDYLLAESQSNESVPAARLLLDQPLRERALVDGATRIDWNMQRELGRQLGLVDWSAVDTRLEQCMVRDRDGRYVQLQHFFPWRETLMCTPGGFPLSEPDAAYLNAVHGRPRGARGEFLYQTPENVILEVLSGAGTPVADVEIEGFQLSAEGQNLATIHGAGASDPLFAISTDANGRVTLTNQPVPSAKTPGGYELRPNPFGKIASDETNGLLLLRLHKGAYEEYHFVRLFDCLTAYLHGEKKDYVHRLQTRFAVPGATASPPYTNGQARADGTFYVGWAMPPGSSAANLEEFRIYKRVGLAGQDVRPWTLDSVCGFVGGHWVVQADVGGGNAGGADGSYSADTFAACVFADKQGRESPPSIVPGFFSQGRDVSAMAVTPEHVAYLTTTGAGEPQMLTWTGQAGTQPIGFRHWTFPGYEPAYGGVAIAQDRKVIVTDPVNHVLAFYDRGDMVSTVPARTTWPGLASSADGEFRQPADVAVDDEGRIYVADMGNDRVQILSANGTYIDLLDPAFTRGAGGGAASAPATTTAPATQTKAPTDPWFVKPDSIAFSNGRICVTDLNDTRVRVYDVRVNPPRFRFEARNLLNADRGLINQYGALFVLGQSRLTGEWGVMTFDKDGKLARYRGVRTKAEGESGNVDHPRGFCYYTFNGLDYGYFANAAPFNIRRTLLLKRLPGEDEKKEEAGAGPVAKP